ncbi:TPA: glycosyltransferase family 2 protein [Pluralibacter gergoviae]
MNVVVLLSTYNGEKFLPEQLDSLLSQTYKNFTILIRDDGSHDNTLNIINEYCARERRIVRLDDNVNIGCAASFLSLMCNTESDIYIFCDQDDVWASDKIERVIDYFSSQDMNQPILYHSDLRVVDEKLDVIHSSFLKYQKMSPVNAMGKNNLFIQNFVVGCTSAVNHTLVQLTLENITAQQFKNIAMHDWWLALTARLFGTIYYDDVQPILYRQHSNNVLGAKSSGITRFLKLGLNGQGLRRVGSFREKVVNQNILLLEVYKDKLQIEDKKNLQAVVNALSENGGFFSLIQCFFRGCYMQGIKRNIALMYSVIFKKSYR